MAEKVPVDEFEQKNSLVLQPACGLQGAGYERRPTEQGRRDSEDGRPDERAQGEAGPGRWCNQWFAGSVGSGTSEFWAAQWCFFGGASGGMGVANMGIFCQRAGCWLRGTCGLVKINLNNSCWTRPDIFGCIVGNILNLGGILTLNRHLRFKSKQFGLKLVWILLQILPTRILGNYKLKAFNITRCPAVHHRQSGNSIRDSSQWCPEMFDG